MSTSNLNIGLFELLFRSSYCFVLLVKCTSIVDRRVNDIERTFYYSEKCDYDQIKKMMEKKLDAKILLRTPSFALTAY